MEVILPPGLILILGAALVPAFPAGRLRGLWVLAVAGFAVVQVFGMPQGFSWQWQVFDWNLRLVRADALSQAFAQVFAVATLAGALYSLTWRDALQQAAVLVYAGAALTAVYAGDLVTLFIGWELTALASAFLIWAQRTDAAWWAGVRYLMVQVTSGLLLLVGILYLQQDGASLRFEWIGTDSAAGWFILGAFALKGAFPLLHAWLTDAYPAATATGAAVMSMFTTKLAMYALMRGYAGTEFLVWVGIAGALYALARMFVEPDARRAVCWALIVQLGMITTAIGVGTGAALAGAALHAFAGVFYIGLMLMALGVVMERTGTMRLDELGGLFKAMPATAVLFMVGAATLSAVPPLAGYLSKSVLLAALPEWAYALMLLVSVAVFALVVRLTVRVFFGASRREGAAPTVGLDVGAAPSRRDTVRAAPLRRDEPTTAIAAMTVLATLCVLFGIWPQPFLDPLPWAVEIKAWEATELGKQLGLLALGGVLFALVRALPTLHKPLPDADWLYRTGLVRATRGLVNLAAPIWHGTLQLLVRQGKALYGRVHRHHGPQGTMARTWPTGSMVIWVAVLLLVALVLYYL